MDAYGWELSVSEYGSSPSLHWLYVLIGSFANTAAPQHQATHNFATGYAPTSYGYAAGYTPATAYTTSAGYSLSQEYMGVAAALPAQEVSTNILVQKLR